MDGPETFLRAISRGGNVGNKAADVLTGLILQGAALGELEARDVEACGVAKTVRAIPHLWMQRLDRAAELGAFDRLTRQQIIDRILSSPASAAAA
jgi:hypothetical protein